MAEKRLIYAEDLLEPVDQKVFMMRGRGEGKPAAMFGELFRKRIEMAPTVDAVEVVRCKDCTKNGLFTCPICFIENKTLQFANHSPDFYCGEGERKDGDGNV